MSNTDNNPKSVIFWLIGTVIVAAISAWGASNASYNNGVAAVEREISATQTAEIRLLTLTPKPTSPPEPTTTPNIIEVTRIVTIEVTRVVEVTRITEGAQAVSPSPAVTPNPKNYKVGTTRASDTADFSATLKSVEFLQNENMRWYFDFKNDSPKDVNIGFNYPETYVVDENGFQYKITDADSGAIESRGWGYIVKRGVKVSHWFEFSGPKDGAKSFTIYIKSGCILCPSYPGFKFDIP